MSQEQILVIFLDQAYKSSLKCKENNLKIGYCQMNKMALFQGNIFAMHLHVEKEVFLVEWGWFEMIHWFKGGHCKSLN